MIEVILYSYKNKNLRSVVDSLINNTSDEVLINVYDQHPIDRSSKFNDVVYNHIFWDSINGPCEFKGSMLHKAIAEHVLIISDDVLLSKNWDILVKNFIQDRDVLVSGSGVVGAQQIDIFSISPIIKNTTDFNLSQYAVREFMFASKIVWSKFQYPYKLKYNGEQELVSLNAFRSGIDIYSAPSSLYEDLSVRTLSSLYVPFSRDHEYNVAVDTMMTINPNENMMYKRSREDFLKFHQIDDGSIKRLPYQNNDVSYTPNDMEFQDVDARKFISNTKAIY